MRYFSSPLQKKIVEKIQCSSQLLFLLDYDGTLSPIVSKPQESRLKRSTQTVLKALTKNSRFTLGIITGRSVQQIKRLTGLKKVIIAGNHGLQLWSPKLKERYNRAAGFKYRIKEMKRVLHGLEEKFTGSYLEDKKISLAYHYRLTNPSLYSKIKTEFFERIDPWVKGQKIRVLEIKKGWEVLPPILWDKGKAVKWILTRCPKTTLSFFIGDDVTDEAAFKALASKGVSIRVGRKKSSAAQYFLKNVPEVEKFLFTLADSGKKQFQRGSNHGT
ncbi:MAG: trehalose-phosphatase [Elusimicrobia bacterium]|nr:trehalose-phosphatase [Elusimicrobiota bacterium]